VRSALTRPPMKEVELKQVFSVKKDLNGAGNVLFAWHPDGSYLACAGSSRIVNISNRQGQPVAEIPLTGVPLALDWDKDGEVLAVLQRDSGVVPLWDANKHKVSNLDTNMKDLTFLKWSLTGPQLAIGNQKGNLLLYNKRTLKKVPILGKHVKRITCGAWNADNKLALASEDKQVTISSGDDGDTITQTMLKSEPTQMRFSATKTDRLDSGRVDDGEKTVVAAVMNRKTLLLYDIEDPSNPIELAFQSKYGTIVSYRWFQTVHLLIGFETGFMVVVSTNPSEVGEEKVSIKAHQGRLVDLAFAPAINRVATCTSRDIMICDLVTNNWSEIHREYAKVPGETGDLTGLGWTADGTMLTVTADSGNLYCFLASLPCLSATCGGRYANLSSLQEISVQAVPGSLQAPHLVQLPLSVKISLEPTLLALGPEHVAIGMNNILVFHSLRSLQAVLEREYPGSVDKACLNASHAAVLSEGTVHVHPLPLPDGTEPPGRAGSFPDGDDRDVTDVALTADLLIYARRRGTVHFFAMQDWSAVCEYRHREAVIGVFPNELGTRVALVDAANGVCVYNPVKEEAIPVPEAPGGGSVTAVLWDVADRGVLATYDRRSFEAYIYSQGSMAGDAVGHIASLAVNSVANPVVLHAGQVVFQNTTGAMQTATLPSHDRVVAEGGMPAHAMSKEALQSAVEQNLRLHRFAEALDVAQHLDSRAVLAKIAEAALRALEVHLALRVYRQLGEVAMVMTISRIAQLEDTSLLAAHVAMAFGDYAKAQDLFLASSRPRGALEMRRNLLHWEEALQLAGTLAPEEVPAISRELAAQLEVRGDYQGALAMYDRARTGDPGHALDRQSQAGTARCLLRVGEVPRGVQLARESGDPSLCRDCAVILEEMKQRQDAALLYEKANLPDRAAAIYIKLKNWAAAGALMNQITSPKLQLEYARAKESDGKFEEAARAYEAAKDMDSVVRLLLERLNQPDRAFQLVRESKSSEGAKMVSRFCQERQDWRTAIEFLILSKAAEEAFELATSHDEMPTFTAALSKGGSPVQYQAVASYYELKGEFGRSGDFWLEAKDYPRALRLYLKCGEKEIDRAIEVVGKARTEQLTHALIDFLMGETDGVPKDPNYIFRLYMALGKYTEAGDTAVIIARQEQELGNYRVAHQILFDTHRELKAHNIQVPQALSQNLMLLHSYVIVKMLIKLNDHLSGARMLIRVAKNISKFPSHVVPILTTTVIECHRSNLRKSAFEYACTLMRPEHRPQVDQRYFKKIEHIVRKPDRTEEEETTSPSPYDPSTMVEDTQLECPTTRNVIPYCIATGRHIVLHDLCVCPSCGFPATYSYFCRVIDQMDDHACPMCSQPVSLASVRKFDEEEAAAWLKKYRERVKDKDGKD